MSDNHGCTSIIGFRGYDCDVIFNNFGTFSYFQLAIEEARESIAQVSKLLRAAREVSKETSRDSCAARDINKDAVFDVALRKKLNFGPHFEIWLPPF